MQETTTASGFFIIVHIYIEIEIPKPVIIGVIKLKNGNTEFK